MPLFKVWEVKNEGNQILRVTGPLNSSEPPETEGDSLGVGESCKLGSKQEAFFRALREGRRIRTEDKRRNPRIIMFDVDTGREDIHQI
jgi:hypothetical protein